MQVGDLVKLQFSPTYSVLGIVTCIDPEEIGDSEEVEVAWHDGDVCNHSTCYLELVNASR